MSRSGRRPGRGTPAPGGHAHGGLDARQAGSRQADLRYLSAALGLVVVFMLLEVIAALVSGSLALLADAGHMLADAGAIGISMWAIRLALRPATDVWTFGLKRAEILSAAINGVTLLVVSGLILVQAVERLVRPLPVQGLALVLVASAGVVVNLGATWALSQANRSSLNIAGSFTHLVTDQWAFLGTVAAGVVILTTGFDRADAIASLVVVGLMLRAAYSLLRESGHVLLEAAPKAVELTAVRVHLLETPHVSDVHDLHAWEVTSDLPALSAHVVVEQSCFLDGHAPQILDALEACLRGHFDVEHSTFQLEPPGHTSHESSLH